LPVPAVVAPASASVKIAQIQYNPPGKDTDENSQINNEFVVIKNIGTHRVTLTDWGLHDTHRHVYRFPTLRLRPGNMVRIYSGRGTDDSNDLYWEQSFVRYIWNNDGDTATLKDDNRDRKDRCHYSGGGTSMNC